MRVTCKQCKQGEFIIRLHWCNLHATTLGRLDLVCSVLVPLCRSPYLYKTNGNIPARPAHLLALVAAVCTGCGWPAIYYRAITSTVAGWVALHHLPGTFLRCVYCLDLIVGVNGAWGTRGTSSSQAKRASCLSRRPSSLNSVSNTCATAVRCFLIITGVQLINYS